MFAAPDLAYLIQSGLLPPQLMEQYYGLTSAVNAIYQGKIFLRKQRQDRTTFTKEQTSILEQGSLLINLLFL